MPQSKKPLIQPVDIDLGNKQSIIPGPDPELEITVKRIPVVEGLGKIIPVCEPFLGGNEMQYVMQCIQTNWISSAGRFILDFENEFAKVCGTRYGIATTSGTTALHLALVTMGLEPGDEVIVTEFGFIMHRIYASLYKAKIILAQEENFKASVNEILKNVTDKTKIVFIANPNNPTGTYLSKSEMLNLRKKLRSDILLVVDDAYFEFLNKQDFNSGLDLFKDSANVFVTRTFSKIYGLAGLRLGWGYCSKEIIDAMYHIKPPFNVNRAALAAGVEAIQDNEWTKRAIEHNTLWSEKIFSTLKKSKIGTNEPAANFFLINFNETKINSDQAFEKLASKRLILRKMIQYKIPNSLRLTIGNKEANEHFIQSIGSILK